MAATAAGEKALSRFPQMSGKATRLPNSKCPNSPFLPHVTATARLPTSFGFALTSSSAHRQCFPCSARSNAFSPSDTDVPVCAPNQSFDACCQSRAATEQGVRPDRMSLTFRFKFGTPSKGVYHIHGSGLCDASSNRSSAIKCLPCTICFQSAENSYASAFPSEHAMYRIVLPSSSVVDVKITLTFRKSCQCLFPAPHESHCCALSTIVSWTQVRIIFASVDTHALPLGR